MRLLPCASCNVALHCAVSSSLLHHLLGHSLAVTCTWQLQRLLLRLANAPASYTLPR